MPLTWLANCWGTQDNRNQSSNANPQAESAYTSPEACPETNTVAICIKKADSLSGTYSNIEDNRNLYVQISQSEFDDLAKFIQENNLLKKNETLKDKIAEIIVSNSSILECRAPEAIDADTPIYRFTDLIHTDNSVTQRANR